MTVTLKFQSTGMVPGDGQPATMQGGSLTVGRGPANDLVLPDPEKTLSKNHFVVEDHNGNVVIVDLSTNGTFLNYSKIPLGRTPTPLNNGDVLTAGGYEMIVEIASGAMDFAGAIAPPAQQAAVSHGMADQAPDPLALLDDAGPGGDFLDDLLGAEGGPKGPGQIDIPDPVDELLPPIDDDDPFFQKADDGRDMTGASDPMHNPSVSDSFAAPGTKSGNIIPDDWNDEFLAPEPPVKPQPGSAAPPTVDALLSAEPTPPTDTSAPVEPLQRTPSVLPNAPDQPPVAPTPAAEPVAAPTPTDGKTDSGDQAAARTFLAALEVENLEVRDEDLSNTMDRMGRVMRILITGLREILMTRTSIKSEFRIDQTMISAGGNNPLKFSFSPEQAIESLVRPGAKGYLEAAAAAEEALNDIKAHEVAMVTGMEAALKGVLAKLNPDALVDQIETSGALGSLFKGKKARYWEIYEKMYGEISDQAENDFHDFFSREFARAYKEQLDKLK